MKKYSFLLKPIFFIFSLLFATWLVVTIEKISPSDFGDMIPDESIKTVDPKLLLERKQYLKKLCTDYKAGAIDSLKLDQKITIFLKK